MRNPPRVEAAVRHQAPASSTALGTRLTSTGMCSYQVCRRALPARGTSCPRVAHSGRHMGRAVRGTLPSAPLRGLDEVGAGPCPSDIVVAPPAFLTNPCDLSIVSEPLPAVSNSPKRGDSTEGRAADQATTRAHASSIPRPQNQYQDVLVERVKAYQRAGRCQHRSWQHLCEEHNFLVIRDPARTRTDILEQFCALYPVRPAGVGFL